MKYLETLSKDMTAFNDIGAGVALDLVQQIEEAISNTSKLDLELLDISLQTLLQKMQAINPEVISLMAEQGSAPSDAYVFGQFNFAHLLVGHALAHRATDDYVELLQDVRYSPYIKALLKEDLSGVELASKVFECVETVSRKMKTLRESGITEFRREGTKLLNFLTPTAREAMGIKAGTFEKAELAKPVKETVEELDLFWRGIPAFTVHRLAA
ncbi:hypothetical protein D9O50_09310 [Oxalobacteraceae bacterium CAVE-383]|nr:hypothetical protein D9O50_09310 [Oxalobacteraceae bacterium CAVE-383]